MAWLLCLSPTHWLLLFGKFREEWGALDAAPSLAWESQSPNVVSLREHPTGSFGKEHCPLIKAGMPCAKYLKIHGIEKEGGEEHSLVVHCFRQWACSGVPLSSPPPWNVHAWPTAPKLVVWAHSWGSIACLLASGSSIVGINPGPQGYYTWRDGISALTIPANLM